MTSSLARYHARAPRYILNTEDNSLVRLSGAEQLSWEEKTELRDVSLTGLSFIAPQDLSPQMGEVIKIQFAVPGSQQMACYAVVIRIEKINQFDNLIGVHFYKLDRTQRLNLVQGLTEKVQKPVKDLKDSKMNTVISVAGLVIALICWITLMKIYFLK
ncbi:PilZ domain-containing protein [bacterium]|nr:PilZ domain-containing protein [bacterium]